METDSLGYRRKVSTDQYGGHQRMSKGVLDSEHSQEHENQPQSAKSAEPHLLETPNPDTWL